MMRTTDKITLTFALCFAFHQVIRWSQSASAPPDILWSVPRIWSPHLKHVFAAWTELIGSKRATVGLECRPRPNARASRHCPLLPRFVDARVGAGMAMEAGSEVAIERQRRISGQPSFNFF